MAPSLGGGQHDFHHIDGDSETDPDRASGLREDRGIDADQPRVKIDESAAGIARIDRRIGLNKKAVVRNSGLGACQGGDNALGHRLPDAKGIADRKNDVADFEGIRVPQVHDGKFLVAFQTQHDKVGPLITQHGLGVEFALIGKRDLHLGHAFDDMIIGDDEPRGIDKHAGAE